MVDSMVLYFIFLHFLKLIKNTYKPIKTWLVLSADATKCEKKTKKIINHEVLQENSMVEPLAVYHMRRS